MCETFDFGCWLTWFFEEIEFLILWVFGAIFDSLILLLNFIPVPDFIKNIDPITLPDSVAYYANFFNIDYGISVISLAYTIRFIIRRLPVVG